MEPIAARRETLIVTTEPRTLRIALGADRALAQPLALPVLAGVGIDELLQGPAEAGTKAGFRLAQSTTWRVGMASAAIAPSATLERETHRLYAGLFEAARGWHLSRIWNYVPDINGTGPDGLEHYRAFCRGRSLAFEARFGTAFKGHLPAASAVGAEGATLTVVFAACRGGVVHVENPSQTPAYEYPATYGPRPPSFARASVVTAGDTATVFISGTSAISGHATVAPFDTRGQLACTLDNLTTISAACGAGAALGAGRAQRRQFKVYLRRASDYPDVATTLNERLLQPGDVVSYLRADICRRELNVEIEATVSGNAEMLKC